jgi:hypothetical protein
LDESAATTPDDRSFVGFESITGEFGTPRLFAPFNPNPLGWHMQQVGADQGAGPLRVGKRSA